MRDRPVLMFKSLPLVLVLVLGASALGCARER
jgi:hypothetical protein